MSDLRIETKCVQGGYTPGNGEPRQIPIIQSTTFKYDSTEHMGKLFALEESGYFYTRLAKSGCEIYQKKIDTAGLHLLQQARASWAGSPNASGAADATRYLAKIDLLASCQPEVEALMQEMTAKVKDDERKAWEFELQKYADAKAREQRDFEFRVRQYEEREAKEQARHEERVAREDLLHKEEVAREQRNFEFEVQKFNAGHERDMAIISASREVALEVAKQIPNINNK